jgi:hypothetical protein
VAPEEEKEEEGEVSLGVIMANTEIFHIFHIVSLFNFPFLSISFHYSTYFSLIFSKSFHFSTYFSSIFSVAFHYSTYFSSIFSVSFHYSIYFSSAFSISFHYSPYLSSVFSISLFTIQLTFLPYFPYHFTSYL